MTKREAPLTGTEIDTSDMGGTAKNVATDTGIVGLVIGMIAVALMGVMALAQWAGLADDDSDSGVEVDLA